MSGFRAGLFLVMGDEAFVAASLGRLHWKLFNLNTGHAATGTAPNSWVSFSRWLLVVEENGEEIPIASFGDD